MALVATVAVAVFVIAQLNEARQREAQSRRDAVITRMIVAFDRAVHATSTWTLQLRARISIRLSGPPAAAVRVSCRNAPSCNKATRIPKGGTLSYREVLPRGALMDIVVTHAGKGKHFQWSVRNQVVTTRSELCRPPGSALPASRFAGDCPR